MMASRRDAAAAEALLAAARLGDAPAVSAVLAASGCAATERCVSRCDPNAA